MTLPSPSPSSVLHTFATGTGVATTVFAGSSSSSSSSSSSAPVISRNQSGALPPGPPALPPLSLPPDLGIGRAEPGPLPSLTLMSSQSATISVVLFRPAGTKPRPGTTPCRTLPSNTTTRFCLGKASQPWVDPRCLEAKVCVVTSVGPPHPAGERSTNVDPSVCVTRRGFDRVRAIKGYGDSESLYERFGFGFGFGLGWTGRA